MLRKNCRFDRHENCTGTKPDPTGGFVFFW